MENTKTCGDGRYGCGETKPITEFPFIEGSATERTLLCNSCIITHRRRVESTGATLPVARVPTQGVDPLENMSAQRRWYYNNREHIKEQARARYYAQEGKAMPVRKRTYTKRRGSTDPRVGDVATGMVEAQSRYELERKLVRKMEWVAKCMIQYISFRNSTDQDRDGAAYLYKSAVQDEEKIRDALGMELRELTGIAEADVEFFALQTNDGGTGEIETNTPAIAGEPDQFNGVTEED